MAKKKDGYRETELSPQEKAQARALKAICAQERGLQARVAARLNRDGSHGSGSSHISQVVNGTRRLTFDIAAAFSQETGRPLHEIAPLLARKISPIPAQIGSSPEPAVRETAHAQIRIKGIARMDKRGFWQVEEQEPAKGRIRRISGDPEAYAIQLIGDALQPRYQSGDFVVIRPSAPLDTDRPVYVVLSDGRATVAELARRSGGEAVLRSLVDGSRMTVKDEEIVIMHRITGQADAIEFAP